METVSIIVPTKDRAELLRATVASVRAQTYPHWELIIVDDRSTDETPEVLKALAGADARIRPTQLSGSAAGAPAGRNAGLAMARGGYVLFLDDDDLLAPTCLAERMAALRGAPDLDFGVFECHLFRETPGDTARRWNAPSEEPDLDRFLRLDVPWQTSSPLWRRSALERLGPWADLGSWQDWEHHVRALAMGLWYRRFPGGVCYWRRPRGGTIGRKSISPAHLRSHQRLLRQVEDRLRAAGRLTPRRGWLLAGLHLWLARRWRIHGQPLTAARVWATQLKRVGPLRFAEGLVWLAVGHYGRVGGRLTMSLRRRWPDGLLWRRSKTFRATPLAADPLEADAPIPQHERA